jgi:hypothetical protein
LICAPTLPEVGSIATKWGQPHRQAEYGTCVVRPADSRLFRRNCHRSPESIRRNGTAALGGLSRAGAIFELTLGGELTTLHQFSHVANGAPTFLIEATGGNLYGVVQGMGEHGGVGFLFRITPAGYFQTLQTLNVLQVGTCPCWLTIGTDGKFYGIAKNSGPGNGSAWVWDLGLPPPKPKVTGVVPTSGAPGAVVTVNGKFLLGATGVSFNGTPATTLSNISANYVSVTVPPGATTGPITLTTRTAAPTSAGWFTVD